MAAFAAVPVTQARASGTAPAAVDHAAPSAVLPGNGVLDDVVATSAGNAWAVGHYGALGNTKSLIEHWNGKTWHRVAAGPVHAWLDGAAATSARDVWVTGLTGGGQALILHFNGRSWRTFRPVRGKAGSLLAEVTAISPRDAWAVGGAGGKTLTEHWNGKTWRRVPSPSPGAGQGFLSGVAAASATNIWAVGGVGHTVTLHWNGTVWRRVTSPSPGRGPALESVAVISAHDVWAVGETASGTLILRWNGSRWQKVASPAISKGAGLLGVSGSSARDVWAVGTTGGLTAAGVVAAMSRGPVLSAADGAITGTSAPKPTRRIEPVILHWNGSTWRRVGGPRPPLGGQLIGVFSGSGRNGWAVGCTRSFGDVKAAPLAVHLTRGT